MTPGLYPEMSAADYHADPCPVPSLSSGLAKVLIRRSPRHARHAHPRFDGEGMDPTAAMDNGSILHRMILGRGDDYEAVEADSWTTKAAREARDAIRDAGRVPVLARVLGELRDGADAALYLMRQHPDCADFFADGHSEAVLIAKDGPAWLRCMVDWMPTAPDAPWFDLKTTTASAAPIEFQRAMVREHAFQARFYMRIGRLLGYRPPAFLFVVIEQKAPHGVSVMTVAPSLAEVADMEVERAVALWRRCMETNHWPGYPARTAYVEAPSYVTAAEEAANMEEAA